MILSLSRVTWTRHLGKPPCSSAKIRGARLVDTMTVFEKTVQNTLLDRVRNRALSCFDSSGV
jgi:hypothetical protein